MRNITSPETTFPPFNDRAPTTPSSSPRAQSALQLTRDAIARWSGNASRATARGDLARVSPQARWLAKTQHDLAAWIECGGFSQTGNASNQALMPPLPGPVMYNMSALAHCVQHCRADACCD